MNSSDYTFVFHDFEGKTCPKPTSDVSSSPRWLEWTSTERSEGRHIDNGRTVVKNQTLYDPIKTKDKWRRKIHVDRVLSSDGISLPFSSSVLLYNIPIFHRRSDRNYNIRLLTVFSPKQRRVNPTYKKYTVKYNGDKVERVLLQSMRGQRFSSFCKRTSTGSQE